MVPAPENGDVAQLGEQLPCTHQVAGSNPVISTIKGSRMTKKREKKFPDNVVYNYETEEFDANIKPYGTNTSAPAIVPNDMSTIKGRAITAAEKYAQKEIDKLRKQAELIMEQVKEVKERVDVSKIIYEAEFNMQPTIGNRYFLYERKDGTHFLSLIAESQWIKIDPGKFLAEVELLPDQTWEIIRGVAQSG